MTTPYPLASFVGGPDTGSYASLQTAFNTLMGTAPTIINQYVDGSQTPAQWPSSVSYGAGTFNQSGMCGDKIPLIGMPMSSSALSDQDNLAYLEAVANTTQYDANIKGMVTTWANAGHKTQYWRPGVEMNLNSTPGFNAWANNPGPWVAAFQKIYTLLHEGFAAEGVTGLVIWNPGTSNSSAAGLATQTLYPGDGYLDAIGADSYGDVWSQGPSDAQVLSSSANMIAYYNDPAEGGSEASDLSPHVLMQFAIDHGKPYCVCESGCGDGPPHDVDDNGVWPGWLRGALDAYVAKGLKVLFVSIWDCPPYAFSGDGSKPNQAAAWAANFGANAPAVPAAPPATPAKPAHAASPPAQIGVTTLYDTNGTAWTLPTVGGKIFRNGVAVPSSANVDVLLWDGKGMSQLNSKGQWWTQPLDGSAGVSISAPAGYAAP